MKIAIISKEAHAQACALRLRERGHEVLLLGSTPKDIPETVDLIVCRTVSSSHHGHGLALQAKRDGREVLFTNSVTGVLNSLERNKKMGKEERSPSQTPRTVYGTHYRAYPDRNGYSIRAGKGFRRYVLRVKSREAAKAKIAELDASVEALGTAVEAEKAKQEETAPVPESDARVEVNGALGAESEKVISSAPGASSPSDPALRGELESALSLFLEEMDKLGLKEYRSHDLAVAVQLRRLARHLVSSAGTACGKNLGAYPATTKLSAVTCKACKESSFYSTVAWAVKNLSE